MELVAQGLELLVGDGSVFGFGDGDEFVEVVVFDLGCVYIYGSRHEPGVTDVRSWVSADHASLDADLYRVVSDWVAREWPLERVAYAPR